jgi:hypothetical protein
MEPETKQNIYKDKGLEEGSDGYDKEREWQWFGGC